MSILKVARMGHPVLRSRARALDPSEVRAAVMQKFIDDMMDTMLEYEGIGLAAPQVHEGVRLFVAGIDDGAGQAAGDAVRQPGDHAAVGDTGPRTGKAA